MWSSRWAPTCFRSTGPRNLGPTLQDWRQGWQARRSRPLASTISPLPSGEMQPGGYVVMQPSVHENYPVKAYRRWMNRIPEVYHTEILREPQARPFPTPTLRHWPS